MVRRRRDDEREPDAVRPERPVRRRAPDAATPTGAAGGAEQGVVGVLGALQHTAGNRAVSRLVSGPAAERDADAAAGAVAARLPLRSTSGGGAPGSAPHLDVRTAAAELVGRDVPVDIGLPAQPSHGPSADASTQDGRIRLAPTVDLGSLAGASVLAHELVHLAGHETSSSPAFHRGEHQLVSPDLAGDAAVVAAFHNADLLRDGDRGSGVALVQDRLIRSGLPMPISTAELGRPDGKFGDETRETVKEFQRRHGLTDDGLVGHETLTALDEVGRPVGPTPLDPGEESRTLSVDAYIAQWEAEHGRTMTDEEKTALADGCIGITELNLGRGHAAPPLNLSFDTFEKALTVRDAIQQILDSAPTLLDLPGKIVASPELAGLQNVLQAFPVDDLSRYRAVIFSKRFWSNQSADPADRSNADDAAFLADASTGQVDMSGYRYEARPGFTNFDYGWWDEKTDSWFHANHADPGMEVYQSTLEHYSRPLQDFDRQVFSVALALKETS